MAKVIWITGLPGSGKSVTAAAVRERIPHAAVLRIDEFRKIMTPEPTYSETERECVYRSLILAAKQLFDGGTDVIIDATGHRKEWRRLARELIAGFCEVYLECPLEVCLEREQRRTDMHGAPKGIYAKGKAGWPVPGLTVAYEVSDNPEMVIQTDRVSPGEAAEEIISWSGLKEEG